MASTAEDNNSTVQVPDVQAQIADLDKRLKWQETLHRKHTADGNVYHFDFRSRDVMKLLGLGALVGLVAGLMIKVTKK